MRRRTFLGVSAGSLGAAFGQTGGQASGQRDDSEVLYLQKKRGKHSFRATPGRRPNIFLISADMVSPDHYHPSRELHRHMRLPALQSLRDDAVEFSNAFAGCPLCAPARAMMMTGRYTYITANGERAHDGHETVLRPDDVIFPEYLKAIGYTNRHCGKGHLGVAKFIDGFDENVDAWDRWAPPIYDDEGYLAYLRGMGVKPQRYRKELFGLEPDRKTPRAALGGWITQADGAPFPLEAQYTRYLIEQAIQKIDAARDAGTGSPIYLQLDLFDPHQPFSIPSGLEDREKELSAAFGLPETYKDVTTRDWRPAPGEPKVYDFYRRSWGLYDGATVKSYRVANALQMEVIDRSIARFLQALKERGLYDESVIIFCADHGEMNGRHALVDKGVYLYPDVLRIPLVIKMPKSYGIKRHRVEAPVSQLDLAPTLLSLTGVAPQERFDGQSLLGYLDESKSPVDRELLFECGWHTGVNFACAVQRWKSSGEHHLYTYNASAFEDELYDLNALEARNLAPNPQFKTIRQEMIARMGRLLRNDPRWIGYWHSFRVDHYWNLPREKAGDYQMFRPQ
ncbi:MAG: sulfatase [Acidobacteria bacterium]|nr:MAG: sulfatase [Acidobacteriota bacterium]